nr:hypothetical protein L203_03267 [Cryptococcus depauperatus CBS 7841]
MFTRFLLRTTTSVSTARMVMSRKASTASRQPVGPLCTKIRQFFRDVGVPVDAYPLVAIIAIVCSGATYINTLLKTEITFGGHPDMAASNFSSPVTPIDSHGTPLLLFAAVSEQSSGHQYSNFSHKDSRAPFGVSDGISGDVDIV